MDAAKSGTRPYRLGAFLDGVGWVEHEYGRVWQREQESLVAAPDYGHVDLLLRLTAELEAPFRILYVRLVPRDNGPDEGRFELSPLLSHDDLETFLRRYRQLFEEDGRQDLVIASANGKIVYDQHNVLTLTGPLERFEAILKDAGVREGEVNFPSPHSHHYHDEHDTLLDDMLERYDWARHAPDGLISDGLMG